MTLTDVEENACCKSMQPSTETEPGTDSSAGLALREALWQAQDQGRLTAGVVECAQLLEKDPFSVMMCVMPVTGPDDVTALIQRTLIEAFCHEYHIRLIKVDSVSKLGKVLQGRALPSGLPSPPSQPAGTGRVPSPSDVSCVLVRSPVGGEGETGKEEEGVSQLPKAVVCDNFHGTVALPDD